MNPLVHDYGAFCLCGRGDDELIDKDPFQGRVLKEPSLLVLHAPPRHVPFMLRKGKEVR